MNYQIFLRIRQSEYSHPFFKVEEQQLVLKAPGTKQIDKFIFDDIFDINSNSEEIVQKIGTAQLDKVILSYGQSGSGKSFTLFGSQEHPGIMPLLLQELLKEKHQLSINYRIIDKENMNSIFVTEDMTTINLFDVQTFWEYYNAFSKQALGKNLIVELKINSTHKMQFVDLIGSQRIAKDISDPQKYQDQIWISSQLQILGKCLVSLAKNQAVPLAESKLTQSLNLTKNAQVILLGQIYPKSENYEETLLTVQYIDRTKNIILAPRKESVRSAEVTRTQLLEKQCKVLEYENKDLKQTIEKLKQEHSRKLKSLKDILCIDFDLEDLTCLSFKELQQFKKQQEAFVINQNLQQTIKEQEVKISQLNQQIKDLHLEQKNKQDKFQLQLIEQKHKNFKMNELMITTKATLSEQIRQISQEKEGCIKSILENSNNLIDQTTNKLYNLPQAAQQKQLDNVKVLELRKQIKQELESEQNKQLNQLKSDYETQINALKQQHEYLMKEKNVEIEQFILQLKKYREKKKNLIREMKEEMLSLFDIITRQQQLIEKIECGGYSGGIKSFHIPAKDKPLMPTQLKFKHLFHFVDRKPPEIINTTLKKSFSVEKKLVITPVNRINRSQTTFQDKPVVFDPSDLDQINHNQMDMSSLKSFVLKLKEMLKKEKEDNVAKQEQLKQQIAAIQKEKEEFVFKYNQESKKYNQQKVAIESQNRLLSKIRPSSSIQRKQS